MAIRSLLKWESMHEMFQGENNSFSLATPFTDNFFTNPQNEESDDFVYLGDPAENRPTPLNVRGGEANILEKAGAYENRGVLWHLFNCITFGKELHEAIAEPGNKTLDRKGAAEVGRQMRHFKKRQIITRELILSKIITTGQVIFDPKTKIIKDSATGDDITITMGVASGHQGDLGGLVTLPMRDTDFDWQEFFDNVDAEAEENNLPIPTDVWVRTTNKNMIRNNAKFQLWAAKNGRDSEQVLRGEMVEDLFGKKWHWLSGGYQNSAGSNVPYMPSDKLVLTAPLNSGWYVASKGLVRVPTQAGLITDVESAMRAEQEVYGEHAFATAEIKGGRVRYNGYAGDCFGFNFSEPGAVWQATIEDASSSG